MRKYVEGVRVIVDNGKLATIVDTLPEEKSPHFVVEYGDGSKQKVEIHRLNRLYGSN